MEPNFHVVSQEDARRLLCTMTANKEVVPVKLPLAEARKVADDLTDATGEAWYETCHGL